MHILSSRSFFFSIITVLFLLGCENSSFVSQDLMDAVPDNCGFFITNKSVNTFFEIKEKSAFDKMSKLPIFENIQQDLKKITPSISDLDLLETEFAAINLNTSIDKFAYIYVFDVSKLKGDDVNAFFKGEISKSTQFHKASVWILDHKYFISKINDFLLISVARQLVEEIIVHLRQGNSIRSSMNVASVSTSPLSIYLRFDALLHQLKPFFRKSIYSEFSNLSALRLDYNTKEHLIVNGAVMFKKQSNGSVFEQVKSNIFTVLPKNIAFFNIQKVAKNHQEDWMGSSYVHVIAIPSTNIIQDTKFSVFEIKDLDKYQDYVKEMKLRNGSEDYNGFEIVKADIQAGDQERYFCDMNGYAVVAQRNSALKIWVDNYIAGQVCSSDLNFLKLLNGVDDSFSASSYLDFKSFIKYLKLFTKPNEISKVNSFLKPFTQIGKILVKNQVQAESFVGIQMVDNLKKAGEESLVWKLKLKEPIATQPFVFRQKESNHTDILVQDTRHSLFCLDENGNKKWQIPLKKALLSNISSIDFYQDQHTYYIFNTKSEVHIIDKNGKYVNGYPYALPEKANTGLLAIDFKDKNGICYFIGGIDGNIYGFNKYGVPLDGWNPCLNDGKLTKILKHFQSDTKDFIFGINENNEIRIYQKDGKMRFSDHVKLDTTGLFCGYDDLESKERIIAISSTGKIKVINAQGVQFGLNLTSNLPIDVAYLDCVGDNRKDFAILSNGHLELFQYQGKKITRAFNRLIKIKYSRVFPISLSDSPKSFIGLYAPKQRRISIVDSTGHTLPKFPIRATQPFDVADLYQNNQSILIGVYKNTIYAYRLE